MQFLRIFAQDKHDSMVARVIGSVPNAMSMRIHICILIVCYVELQVASKVWHQVVDMSEFMYQVHQGAFTRCNLYGDRF